MEVSVNEIVFPKYLREDAFEFRHIKIHIMEKGGKYSTAAGVAKYVEKVATDVGSIIGDEVTDIKKIGIKATYDSINRMSQKIDKAINKNTKIIQTIVLPLPNTLTDAHAHDWSATTGVTGSIADKIYNSGPLAKGVSVISDMSNIRKPLADPGYYQDYAGTKPRTFNMSFDLIPNNEEDATNIYMILNLLRKYSLPESSLNHALILSPHYFKIEFTNGYIDSMIRVKDVVLTSISTDYGADGSMQQMPDGMPKYIKLDLTFAERSMTLSNLYG